jgi:glucosamine-6-phosphate deaminase
MNKKEYEIYRKTIKQSGDIFTRLRYYSNNPQDKEFNIDNIFNTINYFIKYIKIIHTNNDNLDFNLDEYFGLSPEHEQSYYYFMNKHLFRGLDIDERNTHVPCGVGDIQKNCDDYNKMLEENPIDIQLLGLGGNGHIGFNEPFTLFDSVTHYVELEQRTREDNARLFFNGNLDEVPTHAITMGISNIMAAKKVLLIACGENKADAVKALVEGEPTEEIPASVIKNHPNCVVIIDEAAASKLEK